MRPTVETDNFVQRNSDSGTFTWLNIKWNEPNRKWFTFFKLCTVHLGACCRHHLQVPHMSVWTVLFFLLGWSIASDLERKFSLDEPHACDRYNQEYEAFTACKGREALAAWKANLEVIDETRFVKLASEIFDLTPKTKQIPVDISPSLTCRVMAWWAGLFGRSDSPLKLSFFHRSWHSLPPSLGGRGDVENDGQRDGVGG